METVGDRVRALRRARGLTQTELGMAVGVGQSDICQIELYGIGAQGSKTTVMIARYFGVSVDYLLFGEED